MLDLTGKTFGKLKAICIHSRSRNGHIRWVCDCDCGRQHNVLSTHLVEGKITHCGCDPYKGRKHSQWTGCGDISGDFWGSIRRGANGSKGRRIIIFDITIEYAWSLFERQDRKCAISGVPIWFRHSKNSNHSTTASLDRIDSGVGYIVGNVQWVHKDINKMKGCFDQSYFIELCKSVYDNSINISKNFRGYNEFN